jgi:hypothetical protein
MTRGVCHFSFMLKLQIKTQHLLFSNASTEMR